MSEAQRTALAERHLDFHARVADDVFVTYEPPDCRWRHGAEDDGPVVDFKLWAESESDFGHAFGFVRRALGGRGSLREIPREGGWRGRRDLMPAPVGSVMCPIGLMETMLQDGGRTGRGEEAVTHLTANDPTSRDGCGDTTWKKACRAVLDAKTEAHNARSAFKFRATAAASGRHRDIHLAPSCGGKARAAFERHVGMHWGWRCGGPSAAVVERFLQGVRFFEAHGAECPQTRMVPHANLGFIHLAWPGSPVPGEAGVPIFAEREYAAAFSKGTLFASDMMNDRRGRELDVIAGEGPKGDPERVYSAREKIEWILGEGLAPRADACDF